MRRTVTITTLTVAAMIGPAQAAPHPIGIDPVKAPLVATDQLERTKVAGNSSTARFRRAAM